MTTELMALVNWFGTFAGILGVGIAVYLQLINPRHVEPGYVVAIFVAGAAVILVFSPAWADTANTVFLKLAAAVLFVVAELTAGFFVWKNGEVAPFREAVAACFTDENGGSA